MKHLESNYILKKIDMFFVHVNLVNLYMNYIKENTEQGFQTDAVAMDFKPEMTLINCKMI